MSKRGPRPSAIRKVEPGFRGGGDPPLGTGKACVLFRASVSLANVLPIPSGQWPDDERAPIPAPALPRTSKRSSGMLVSIVLRTYNEQRHLRALLQGIVPMQGLNLGLLCVLPW